MQPVLDIHGLKVLFRVGNTYIRAVEGVDITVGEGESVAIVGESGCGKSVTGLACMKLLAQQNAVYTAKKMTLQTKDGHVHDLLSESENGMLALRAEQIAMIFQDPSTFLNPVMTVGEQMDEVFLYHAGAVTQENGKAAHKLSRDEAKRLSLEQFRRVGIPDPEMRYKQFPHELSGGLKQRILIAMATACKPRLLIADEPTTALDVTIQAQILDLITTLRRESGMSLLMITHDLGVVRAVAERCYVMYCGKIVEHGYVRDILEHPLHPYTKALIDTVPGLDDRVERFVQIPHNVPHPSQKPSGCFFSNRCAFCTGICQSAMPPLREPVPGQQTRCWFDKEELWEK